MPVNVKFILRTYFLTVLCGIAVLFIVVASVNEPGRLQIYFFDVGQGDSILIRTPDHHTILVDGGPDQTVVQRIGSVLPWYDRTIDVMILTHPHSDHINGLIPVLARYRVSRVLFTDVAYNSPMYQAWRTAVAAERSVVTVADHLGRMDLGGGVYIDVLYPAQSLSGNIIKNLNDSSIVFHLSYGVFNALLMGDQEREEALTAAGLIQPATVLKVGHHGSRNASDASFLLAVQPKLAVISDGAHNRYGHPHNEALTRLATLGARVLRTDLDGTIVVESDGTRWWATPPLKNP